MTTVPWEVETVKKTDLALLVLCLMFATMMFATIFTGNVLARSGNDHGSKMAHNVAKNVVPSRHGLNFSVDTEVFTVKFAGSVEVPKFQYWYNTTEANRTIYQVFFHQLFEFDDTDGDGAYNKTKDKIEKMFALPSADLSLAGPEYITKGEEVIGVQFNFTLLGKKGGPSKGVNMTLQCSFYNETQTITIAGGTTYNVTGSAELKIDVIINSWPWKDDDNMLGLWWSVNQQNQTVQPSITNNSVTLGGGYFKWISNATLYGEEGNESVPVNSSFNMTDNTVNVYMSYPNFHNKTLVHDPSLGVIVDTVPLTIIDTTPPTILSMQQSPTTNISPDNYVTITINVVDATSGITSVTLMYSADNEATWNPISMAKSGDQYVASIPKQKEGTTVKYYVIATDSAGNSKISSTHSYTVNTSSLQSWVLYGVGFMAIVIVAIAYYIVHTRKHPCRSYGI